MRMKKFNLKKPNAFPLNHQGSVDTLSFDNSTSKIFPPIQESKLGKREIKQQVVDVDDSLNDDSTDFKLQKMQSKRQKISIDFDL